MEGATSQKENERVSTGIKDRMKSVLQVSVCALLVDFEIHLVLFGRDWRAFRKNVHAFLAVLSPANYPHCY
jgi:hypothetical protein